jgi:hypothetical protein
MALMADFSIRRRDLLALGATPWLASGHADGTNAPRGVTEQSGRPADRRHELYALLGKLPERHRPIKAEKLSEAERDGYILESWQLDLNGLEPVPAIAATRSARQNSSKVAATCSQRRTPRR